MVWPITGAESYAGETGKSMRAGELADAQEDSRRKIAITLINPLTTGFQTRPSDSATARLENYTFLTPEWKLRSPIFTGLPRERFRAGFLKPLP